MEKMIKAQQLVMCLRCIARSEPLMECTYEDCIYDLAEPVTEINSVFASFAEDDGCFHSIDTDRIINEAADFIEELKATNLLAETPSLFECSACGWRDFDTTTGDTNTYNFCPNCGRKIGGLNNETRVETFVSLL